MVLSGLADSLRVLISHIGQSTLKTFIRREETMENISADHIQSILPQDDSMIVEDEDEVVDVSDLQEELSMHSRNTGNRIVPIKRKLEDLELDITSPSRHRRETREDCMEEVVANDFSIMHRDCNVSVSFSSDYSAVDLGDKDEDFTEVKCNIDYDIQHDDNKIFSDGKSSHTSRAANKVIDTGDYMSMNVVIEDSKSGRIESFAKDPDHGVALANKASTDHRDIERSHEVARASVDYASERENGLNERDSSMKRKLESDSDPVCHDTKKSFMESTSSSSMGQCFCDEKFSSISSSHMPLQFFVRTYIDGRTIVLHGNAFDTIESVHRQIFLKTGLPLSEQRLIYFGKQLQNDQTLAQCQVVNDATLHLVARMRSTALPHSWQLINNLVAMIRITCAIEYDEGRDTKYRMLQAQINIKSGVKDYLKLAMKSAPFSEHMQVFQLAGATSALVMLLLSPIELNSECAEESIRLFFCSNEDCLPSHLHSHCAPVLLDFCKLLGKSAPFHPLYSPCRNALACLLDTTVNEGSYFHDAKSETIIQDFAPFVHELSVNLCSNLQSVAHDLRMKERPAQCSDVKDGQDFTAFASILCKAMGARNGESVYNPPSSAFWVFFSQNRSVRNSSKAQFDMGSFVKLDEAEDESGLEIGLSELEMGSHRWLKCLFHQLSQAVDACLAAIQQYEGFQDSLQLLASDEGRWAHFLVVLKGLHVIAQLFEQSLKGLIRMLQTRHSALNFLIKHSRWHDDHSWLLDYKFLLNFESRRRLVMATLPEPQDDHDERQEIVVSRSKVLSDSFEVLAYADADALQGGISVEFISEEATGPGVLREWFSLICREIFNPQNALFKSCPCDQRRVFPSYASGVNPGHLTYFRFCGRVIALALMHRVQINVLFSLAFFKQLAGLSVSWNDIRDADPELYESCRKILLMDDEEIDSDVLGLTFIYEEEQLGIMKTIELCPGGKDIIVDSKNRSVYVEYMVQQRFVTCVIEQVKSFAQGFSELMTSGNIEHFLKGLDPEDFDSVLHGNNQDIGLEDWKLHTEYHEYDQSDEQIIWFWQVLEGMTNEQRRKLLFFSTSVTHLPAEGFAGLSSKFHIHKGHSDMSWLPTAHTCFFQLILPCYPTFQIMYERLFAITDRHLSEGFGFA